MSITELVRSHQRWVKRKLVSAPSESWRQRFDTFDATSRWLDAWMERAQQIAPMAPERVQLRAELDALSAGERAAVVEAVIERVERGTPSGRYAAVHLDHALIPLLETADLDFPKGYALRLFERRGFLPFNGGARAIERLIQRDGWDEPLLEAFVKLAEEISEEADDGADRISEIEAAGEIDWDMAEQMREAAEYERAFPETRPTVPEPYATLLRTAQRESESRYRVSLQDA